VVVVAVCVLDETLAVVSGVVATGVAAVVGSDMAVGLGGSGCGTQGWGVCWGAVGRVGSVCRRSRGAGGCFKPGDAVVGVVVVVDGCVDVADGGCVGVVSGGVANSCGDGGLVGVSS
jgi:hypothetical protein